MPSTRPTAQPTTNGSGHPSRSDNQSISSTVSSKSDRGSDRGSERGTAMDRPAVESAVTRLLVSTKQLLEALSSWSNLQVDEQHISDLYVRFGNDFNLAVAAFASYNIDMSELIDVPNDLRTVLEQCLSEEANQENLELYLPTVREIITRLLQGLRGKQSAYRKIVQDYRHRSPDQDGQERNGSRSSRSSRRDQASASHRSQLSRTAMENNRDAPQNPVKRRQPSATQTPPVSTPDEPPLEESPLPPPPVRETPSPQPNGAQGRSPHRRQRSTTNLISGTPPRSDYFSQNPLSRNSGMSISHSPEPELPPRPDPPTGPLPQVPANVKRYSLVDRPAPPPTVVVDEVASPQETSPSPEASPPPSNDVVQSPAIANSLAALKKSDTLERRASKRFSTYNISKLTGSGRLGRSGSNRRSLAAGSAPTPGELAVLTEVDEGDPSPGEYMDSPPQADMSGSPTPSRVVTPPPPPPKISEPTFSIKPPAPPAVEKSSDSIVVVDPPAPPSATSITVFLQVGREVKKANVEVGLSLSSLRMLFVDRFSYSPGMDNFPAIYIRDPSSGVQYELEDVEEVKEKCLLSLNIEPLDQIKQHIDTQISTLSQDLKELRTAVISNRQSTQGSTIIGQPLDESTPVRNRPTERQFQHLARRLSHYVGDRSSDSSSPLGSPLVPDMTGQSLQTQMTGGSVLSEYTSRVVTDLKTQFDEVQNLRRDLGVMRQLYTEFMKTTKDSLGSLRNQARVVKQVATTKVGGARSYINSGKKSLDTRSQNVLTEVEKLQDIVEAVKDDVLKRQVNPTPKHVKNIQKDITSISTELQSLSDHLKTVRPMWKKTWEEELQNIVEEQQFLTHQEEFLNDLHEDHKALTEIFGHVEKVISIRSASRVPRTKGYRPPPPDEGHTGLSTVMLEIRGAVVDPERRLEAIERNQKMRQQELANRTDELHSELANFVGGKKLKMTGGAEEAERVRQRRNEMTMKAMFNGGVGTPSALPSPSVDSVTSPSTPTPT